MTDDPDTVIATLRTAEPPRVWSLIVTLFGDAIVPRGGAVASRTVQHVVARLGIEPGAVRTALSRLARDGWVVRERRGRHSHYALSETGRAPFAAASRRIYAATDEAPDTRPRLLAVGPRERRDGDGAAGATRAISPGAPDPVVDEADGPAIELRANLWLLVERDAAQRERLERHGYLVAGAVAGPLPEWLAARLGLPGLAARYASLEERFAPLVGAPPDAPLDALVARLVLIHEWRRLLLRTPELPSGLLPADWPVPRVRALVATLYRELLPASTRWLDTEARGPDDMLPPDDACVGRRFVAEAPFVAPRSATARSS